MLFNSMQFLIFLPIVILLYYFVSDKFKMYWLLLASYYFYMCWNAKYALLILFSTFITYICGILLEHEKSCKNNNTNKKIIVAISLILNLGVLFIFKYTGFISELLQVLFLKIGISINIPKLDILLPVGISFYTFQALGYTIDVYRDEIYAEKNFFRYALFVAFFPQLVAGPIERSKNLLKQLAVPKKIEYNNVIEGIWIMLWGFFLKMVLADRIAIFVDTVYGDYMQYGGYYLIVATMLFAVQIYCDFYGYSTIAVGTARILGIQLMENFDAPYLATSVAEFWRRWHISLTSWFKDYLYIPLGGSRKGQLRKYINKMIVFLASGLWHGAELSFVVWGGINGLFQVIGELLKPIRDCFVSTFKINRASVAHRIVHMAGTFLLIDFSWLFFRANTIKDAFNIIRQMHIVRNPGIFFNGALYNCGLDSKNWTLMIVCIGVLLVADICKYNNIQLRNIILKQDLWFRCFFMAFAVLFILLFGIWGPAYSDASFIYFQF